MIGKKLISIEFGGDEGLIVDGDTRKQSCIFFYIFAELCLSDFGASHLFAALHSILMPRAHIERDWLYTNGWYKSTYIVSTVFTLVWSPSGVKKSPQIANYTKNSDFLIGCTVLGLLTQGAN